MGKISAGIGASQVAPCSSLADHNALSEERWRSEGIQIGGVRSARGVLGYWFDK